MKSFKVLSHQTCSVYKHSLLRVYTALVGSRLDYDSVVYGAAKNGSKISRPSASFGRSVCVWRNHVINYVHEKLSF